MKSLLSVATLALISIFASANSHAAIIDFEDQFVIGDGLLLEGQVVTGITLFGATFNVFGQGNTGGNPRDLMLFDADCVGGCTGGDNDLFLQGAGNILIISEDNDSNDPDDSQFGGTISVDFNPAVMDIMALTVDVGDNNNQNNGDSFVKAFFNGNELSTFDFLAGQGNNNLQTADFSGLGSIDRLEIHLESSGGIVNLEFTPVPIPAALPMFLAGLMSLFSLRKKRI